MCDECHSKNYSHTNSRCSIPSADFDKIKFTIKTKSGKEVSVQADRCGGNTSYAKVEKDGKEVFRHEMPDEEDKANVAKLEAEYPGAMVCFVVCLHFSPLFLSRCDFSVVVRMLLTFSIHLLYPYDT